MSTSILKALPGKFDIIRHSPCIFYISRQASLCQQGLSKPNIKIRTHSVLYISASLVMSTSILRALPCKLDIKRRSPSIFYIWASILKALPSKLDIKDTYLIFSIRVQWLSGRVLDLRWKSHLLEPHSWHCTRCVLDEQDILTSVPGNISV